MKQTNLNAVIFKLQMPEAQREQLNEAGSWSDVLWGDAYLDLKQISKNHTTGLGASLYMIEASGFYNLDSVWDVSERAGADWPVTYDHLLGFIFESDNRPRYKDPAVWRQKQSHSLSVGDVVAFTDLKAETDEPVVFLVASVGFIRLTKAQAKIFKSRTRNHAWMMLRKAEKARKAA